MRRWAGPFEGRPVEFGLALLLAAVALVNLLDGYYGGVVVALVGLGLVVGFVAYTGE